MVKLFLSSLFSIQNLGNTIIYSKWCNDFETKNNYKKKMGFYQRNEP